MKTLDRYIMRKILVMFSFIAIAVLLVVCIFDFIGSSQLYFEHGLTLCNIAYYYLVSVPSILNLVIPIIVFISLVLVVTKLAGRNEIIAFLSTGVPYARILFPFVCIFGVTIVVVLFIFSNWILPMANKKLYNFESKYQLRSAKYVTKDIHVVLSGKQLLYVADFDVPSQVGKNVWIDTFDKDRLIERISAESMAYNDNRRCWELNKWTKKKYNDKVGSIIHGDKYDLRYNIKFDDIVLEPAVAKQLNFGELNTFIGTLSKRGSDKLRFFIVERYVRVKDAISIIVLTFMAVLLCSTKTRMGNQKQIIFSFILAFIFIGLSMFFEGVAKYSKNSLIIIMWVPCIVFSIVSALQYLRVPK